jgi:spermidine synthase
MKTFRSVQNRRRRSASFFLILPYGLCFLSGVAGLTYEVLWLRLLTPVVGNTAWATAAVLAATMTGLGLGSLAAGAWAERSVPLRLFGLVEVALGLFALAVPTIAAGASHIAPAVFHVAPGGSWLGGLLRFVVAATVVLVPACLMGAAVPILVRWAQLQWPSGLGPATSLLYGLNTAGAAVGCVITGYVLLGRWGLWMTTCAAASINLFVGSCALLVHQRRVTQRRRRRASSPDAPPTLPLPPWLCLCLAFTAGLCMLALEGLWMRLLLIVLGHDVHAFACMLANVLVGLALGSLLYRFQPLRWQRSAALVPLLFFGLALTTITALALFGHLYVTHGASYFDLGSWLPQPRSHERSLLLQPLVAALLVLVPSVLSGAIVPALCARYGSGSTMGAGQRVGRVLAANTFGAILGSLLPMAALVPALGIQRGVSAVAALALAAGLLALAMDRPVNRQLRWGIGCWAVSALALACALMPSNLAQRTLARKIGPNHLDFLHYEEGRTAVVAVVRNRINGEKQLFVNGVNEVTTRLVHDQSFKLLGHLGLLLHPHPREVLVLCLGGGLSAGAVATHDVESIEIVDLERSVAQGARSFSEINNGVLDDPRVQVVIDDGRHHLRRTRQHFDVIVVDSTHPRAVDSWLLYTKEFYAALAARLGQPGFLVQWLPLHGLSVDEFRIIVGTFLDEFPRGSLWINVGFEPYGQAAYALLLGPTTSARLDVGTMRRRLGHPAIARDLSPWGLDSVAEILECFVAGPEALARWTGHLPVNRDDLPWTQFVTPFSRAAPMEAARLLEVREPPLPHFQPSHRPSSPLAADLRRRYLAQGFLLAGELERALASCPDDCRKLPDYVVQLSQGPTYYRRLQQLYPHDADRLLEAAAGFQRLGQVDAAVTALRTAVEQAPRRSELWTNLGLALADQGDHREAERAWLHALLLAPDAPLPRLNLGLTASAQGLHNEAEAQLHTVLAQHPQLPEAWAALGRVAFQGGQSDQAEEALRRALELDPRQRDARINLGRLYLERDRLGDAWQTFYVGRRLYPFDGDMLFNLAVAQLRRGFLEAALPTLEAARRVNPEDSETADLLQRMQSAREQSRAEPASQTPAMPVLRKPTEGAGPR